VLALAAAVAGCSGGGSLPSAHSAHSRSPAASPSAARGTAGPAAAHSSARPLSVRVVLPARTLPAGSRMTGRILVRNRTGHALHLKGCLSLFQVALASRTYHPKVAWPLCLQRLTIPAGLSSYRVQILATYLQCTKGPPQGGVQSCPPRGMPALPPGVYHTQLFQSLPLAAPPAPVTVRVTAPRSAR